MPSGDEQHNNKRKTKTVAERASKPDEEPKKVVVVRHYRPDPHAQEMAIRTLLAGERECKKEERHDS